MSLVVAFTTKCNSIKIAFNVKFWMSKERSDTRHMTTPVEVESESGCAIHNLLTNIVSYWCWLSNFPESMLSDARNSTIFNDESPALY